MLLGVCMRMCVCLCVCILSVCMHTLHIYTHHIAHVDVRGQLVEVGFLLTPCGPQGLD